MGFISIFRLTLVLTSDVPTEGTQSKGVLYSGENNTLGNNIRNVDKTSLHNTETDVLTMLDYELNPTEYRQVRYKTSCFSSKVIYDMIQQRKKFCHCRIDEDAISNADNIENNVYLIVDLFRKKNSVRYMDVVKT